MKSRIIISALIIFAFCVYVKAFAEVTVNAEVDKVSIAADETVTYKLVVASTEDDIFEPVMPDFAGFTVISRAQSSTISFIEGGVKTVAVYVYILAPKDNGKLKIGPALVKVKDKSIASREFEIEVKPASPVQKYIPEEEPAPFPEAPAASGQSRVTL